MAKASVTLVCSDCGAEYIRTKICANRRDADSWEAWTLSHSAGDVCPDCYHRRQREAAEQKANTVEASEELPALIGSEKQIAWARTIRADIIDKVHKYTDGKDTTDAFQVFWAWLIGQNKAAWWIDNRSIQSCDNGLAVYELSRLWQKSQKAED